MALHLTSCEPADRIAPASELLELARQLERGDLVVSRGGFFQCEACSETIAEGAERVGPRETAAIVAALRAYAG